MAVALSLGAALAPAQLRAAPPQAEAAEASAPQEQLVPPQLIGDSPVYTYPEVLLEREEPPGGEVILQYVVGSDGLTKDIEVLEGIDPLIDAVAVEVVTGLRFEPATYAGEAVEVRLSIAIPFTPPEREPDPEGEGDPEGDTVEYVEYVIEQHGSVALIVEPEEPRQAGQHELGIALGDLEAGQLDVALPRHAERVPVRTALPDQAHVEGIRARRPAR